MGALDFAQSFLGTSVGLSANSNTAAAQTPGKSVISNVRSVSATDGLSKVDNETVEFQIALVQGQSATTPQAKNDEPPFPDDQYRAGIPETVVDVDGINNVTLHKRQLDEQDDQIASISITKQVVAQVLQDSIANGDFSGTFEGNVINSYSRFFLESVVEQQTEKYQVVETFTSFYVFFYGKRPSFYRYSGTLLNDPTHKWINDMMFFYENFFRGTRTAEIGAQAVMSYDGRVVTGFIVGMTMQQAAANDKGMPFSIDFLVVDHFPVNFSADISTLIQNKTAQLQAQAAAIQAQIADLNKNVNTEKAQIAAEFRNGKRMGNSVQSPLGPDKAIPPQSVAS